MMKFLFASLPWALNFATFSCWTSAVEARWKSVSQSAVPNCQDSGWKSGLESYCFITIWKFFWKEAFSLQNGIEFHQGKTKGSSLCQSFIPYVLNYMFKHQIISLFLSSIRNHLTEISSFFHKYRTVLY